MSRLSCEQARLLAPEFALGIISGDERAQLVEHVTSCADCRRLLEDLAVAADSVLLLAPEHEPPGGFESKVLARIKVPGRRRQTRLLWAAAVLTVTGLASAGAALWATAEDRDLGAHYRHALEEADGDYFGVRRIVDANGDKLGNVFVYTGHTDWVFVVFEQAVPDGSYRAEAKMEHAGNVSLAEFDLIGSERTWGQDVSIDLRHVAALRFRTPSGEVLVARFP